MPSRAKESHSDGNPHYLPLSVKLPDLDCRKPFLDTMQYLPRLALLSLLSLATLAGNVSFARGDAPQSKQVQQTKNTALWQVLRPAMLAFQNGGAREEFLAVCKKLLADYPGSTYDAQLQSLIEPLEREVAVTPAFMQVPEGKRSQEQTIRYWVYQLRDVAGHQWSDPGYPEIFPAAYSSKAPPMATDELVAIGVPAIPYLIDALEDDTPTRTIAWQRSFYPVYFVLRRKDLAMKCLERITGCDFYDEGATYIHLHNDTPERRASVLANVRAWWRISQGVRQTDMIRNQLRLRQSNLTLRGYDEIDALQKLAMLEGPAMAVERMQALLATDHYGLNSPIVEAMDRIDPQKAVQSTFARFQQNQSRDGDYVLLLRYGNRATYQEMARRYEATGKMDPGLWNLGDEMEHAVRYGRSWAIPLLAKTLEQTKMTGSRSGTNLPPQSFSDADIAVEQFQKLTGHDFGYKRADSVENRLAAIAQANRWWQRGGRTTLRPLIEAEHRPVENSGDLFWSQAKIDGIVALLTGMDTSRRRKAVASLDKVYSYQVQQALL